MSSACCSACGSEMAADASFCSRCGARKEQPRPERVYTDAWNGLRLGFPRGWRVVYPPVVGLGFEGPGGELFVEMGFAEGSSARSLIDARLQRLRPTEARILDDASALFQLPGGHGQLRARWHDGRGVVWLIQTSRGPQEDLTSILQEFVRSVEPAPPVARSPWREPVEGSLTGVVPEGWHVESAVVPQAGGRQPVFRATLNRDVFAVAEGAFQSFNGPPPHGTGGLVHEGLVPHWLAQMPGARLLAWDHFGHPSEAHVTLGLPNGHLRIYRVQIVAGPGMWVGGTSSFYQGPPSAMLEHEATMRGMLASLKIAPEWSAREQMGFSQRMAAQAQLDAQWMQLQQGMHEQRMHDIAASGAANTARHQMRQEMADGQFRSWQQADLASDRTQRDAVNSIRERADFVDRSSGEVFNVSADHERVWSDGRGHLLGGSWHLQPPGDWTELQRWKPGDR